MCKPHKKFPIIFKVLENATKFLIFIQKHDMLAKRVETITSMLNSI
jgi:hypothetical protein